MNKREPSENYRIRSKRYRDSKKARGCILFTAWIKPTHKILIKEFIEKLP